MHVSFLTYLETMTEYYKNHAGSLSEMRAGQYMMNTLFPSVSDPDIFYEKDDNKAFEMFREKYVEYEG